MKRFLVLLAIVVTLSLLGARQTPSLYSDHKSFNVGDVITILIEESTSAEAAAGTDTDVNVGARFLRCWHWIHESAQSGRIRRVAREHLRR